MEQKLDLIGLLEYIDPGTLDYQDWVNVGMALKQEGYTAVDWDAWSKRDSRRYHPGECEKKWNSFTGAAAPVTGGTIVQMAKDNGWAPERPSHELGWDDEIGSRDDLVIVNHNWLEGKDVVIPAHWDPVKQLVTYLETLFEASENVGYVTECYEKEDNGKVRYLPTKGCCDRTSGELVEALQQCEGDIGRVLGDSKPEAGAWIRFNPLDGKGVKNENVTEYRYALVESDTTDIDRQNAILRELELPIACLVYSGGKSLHAIVRIDAPNFDEYRKRVDYLYEVCKKNGLDIDRQNRNPSRLSRMPGIMRGKEKQYLLDTNIGKSSWVEWKEWIESVNDNLPDPECIANLWDDLPELAPSLISGVLRQGHKMLLAGPSKAGKSYALIELCCAIAEGRQWLGFDCAQGKVMYVNLELDRASCLHRFKDVYTALQWPADNLGNIVIWNLRGKSQPMDKLAPKLIRRAEKENYIAIIIDPIYKIITGDENSAEQMSLFCNQFDRVCTELGCAVIYCHHHSKGAQGDKRSMDRASGSGVFARDPDAMIDLIELEPTEELLKHEEDQATCAVCETWLQRFGVDIEADLSLDDRCSASVMTDIARARLQPASYKLMMRDVDAAKKTVRSHTAWRVEGTLREFPRFDPINMWFNYPIHSIDTSGALHDLESAGAVAWNRTWKNNFSKKKTTKDRKDDRDKSIETAFEACKIDGKVTVAALAEYTGKSEKTMRRQLKEHGGFWVDGGEVGEK